MKALVRTGLFLALTAAPLLSAAQDDTPWWKRLFKQETVNELEKPTPATPDSTQQESGSKLKPGKQDSPDLTPIDSLILNPSVPVTTNPGVVRVVSPAAVDSLNSFRQRHPLPISGYRIQIFQGSVTEAKEARAEFVRTRAKDPVHLVQTRPYFAIRIGDFRTELEAYKRLMELRDVYPGAYVVADRIEMPPIGE
jgi:hypothetical protein